MIPSNFQRDVTQLIEESSQDLSVSRPLSRVPWAIPVVRMKEETESQTGTEFTCGWMR